MRAVLAAVAALAVAAPGVGAADPPPPIPVSFTDLGAKAGGAHRIRVDWNAACPDGSTYDGVDSGIALMHVPKRAGARVVTDEIGAPDAPTGSFEGTALPGRKVFARVTIVCENEDEIEVARFTGDSPNTLFVPPAIVGWSVASGETCNKPGHRDRRKGIGRAAPQTVDWKLVFGKDSMLNSPSTTGMLKEIRLRASGRQLRLRVGPASGALRRHGVYEAHFYSPNSGSIKLWAEIGGVATNKITVRTIGIPCTPNPKSYYGYTRKEVNTFIRD